MELSDQEFKTAMISILRTLVDREDKHTRTMGVWSERWESQKEPTSGSALEIKNTGIRMKNLMGFKPCL